MTNEELTAQLAEERARVARLREALAVATETRAMKEVKEFQVQLENVWATIRGIGAENERLRRERSGREKFVVLALSFPSLREAAGLVPWDVERFTSWLNSREATTPAGAAGRFVLGVWDPRLDWAQYGLRSPTRFDVLQAFLIWDREHVAAFLRWAELPFWP